MPNQTSIKYLSSLLDNPAAVAEGDKASIASFVQSYPYFVPARYLTALDAHKKASFSPGMLTSIEPYMGNWILFCDFLDEGIGGSTPEYRRPYTYDQPASEPVAEYNTYTAPVSTEEDIPEVSLESTQPDFTTATLVEEFVFNRDIVPEEPVTIEENTAEESPDVSSREAYEEPAEETTAEAEEFSFNEIPTSEPIFAAAEAESVAEVTQGIVNDFEITDGEPQEAASLIMPVFTTDYFQQQGERIPDEIPGDLDALRVNVGTMMDERGDEPKNLMVVMSFSEWLLHFKNTAEKEEEETRDQKALKTMWQKEKLAAALEEENEEIPENVFEMAVNSITKEDGLASETLADIYIKQGKYDKAIEMYRKLSLRNPQKSAYFARKIEEVLKDKQS